MNSFFFEKIPLKKFHNASAAIIIDSQKNYLLQHRDNNYKIFFPNYWGLFGGAKEKNESYSSCLIRELNEEIGIQIKIFKFLFKFSYNLNFKNRKKINRYFYEIKFNSNIKKNIKLNEGQSFKFFKYSDLISLNLTPYDSYAIWLHKNFDTK